MYKVSNLDNSQTIKVMSLNKRFFNDKGQIALQVCMINTESNEKMTLDTDLVLCFNYNQTDNHLVVENDKKCTILICEEFDKSFIYIKSKKVEIKSNDAFKPTVSDLYEMFVTKWSDESYLNVVKI